MMKAGEWSLETRLNSPIPFGVIELGILLVDNST